MKCLVIGGYAGKREELEPEEATRFEKTCTEVGKSLAISGQSISICSPFPDSADFWVFKGFKESDRTDVQAVDFFFVDLPNVRSEVDTLIRQSGTSKVNKIPSTPLPPGHEESLRYSWLLCQLQALDACHVVIAIGGKLDGAANMLLLLAESKNKPVLPLAFFGGAAERVFERKRYELSDKLGHEYTKLQDAEAVNEVMGFLPTVSVAKSINIKKEDGERKFFISYPRARPQEADFIETLLRRRNKKVFRDDSDFGAGHTIPGEIKEAIYSSDVFVATWCRDYACSPWCFDELELALDRFEAGNLEIWIFSLDDTRMIPKRARDRLTYQVRSRDEIEGKLLGLLDM